MFVRLCALATCLLAFHSDAASSVTIPVRPNELFPASKSVDALINHAVRENVIPGAVLLVGHDGEIVYRKAYGQRALLPKPEPMTPDTIFDCASLTKVVATTSSVMRLFEQGKIRISDKVTEYLPEFQHGASDITIRDLMTHYSGLRPDLDLTPPWSGYQTGIDKALNDPPAGPPATKFVYSDINFVLMGEIVHRISGRTLDQFAQEQIFRPLSMSNTTFRPAPSLSSVIAPTEQVASGEILRGVVHDPTSRYMGGVAGHAGLFSTADDLALFCQMMINKGVNPSADATHPRRLFSPLTVDLFTSPQSPPGAAAVRGLGWDINSPYSANRGELFPAGSSYGHTGFTGTSLWLDPGSQTFVILLTNAVHPHPGKKITNLRKSVATAVAAAVGYPQRENRRTRTGLDVLEDQGFKPLLGKRVALLTNQTGVDCRRRRNVDVMKAAGVKLTAVLSPEHGVYGREDRENVADTKDPATGIRVYSLFTERTHRPTAAMLQDADIVVFDIADVGARFYTYATTMAYALEECARLRKSFMVLDRPNPVTGIHVSGPVLDVKNESFVGYFPMPVRHGMTMGELARMFNAENHLNGDLTVVPMVDWSRGEWFDQTGLPWIDPSPNMRDLTAATLYTGTAMLEYSENLSVGRGTGEPFHVIGAKWMDGPKVAAYLNNRNVPGVRAYPTEIRPEASHFAGQRIDAVRFIVTDRALFDSCRLGLEIAAALQKLYPGKIRFDDDRKLIGNDAVLAALERGEDPETIERGLRPALDRFLEIRQKYLLYDEIGPVPGK